MILDIPKSDNRCKTRLLAIFATLLLIIFTHRVEATTTTPYSPEIDILNASSTMGGNLLNKSSSSIVSINAVKVWQENGEFTRKLKKRV